MKRIVFILVLSLLLGACERKKDTVIRMETSLGNIRLKLYDETVLHRDNILKLIREGYYNGMLFHRVIKDFMIQTGDPDSKSARPGMVLGANDIGYTLKAEIVPKYFHKRGVLAAAREADNINPERSSSGSHFYIVQGRIFTPDIIDEEIEKINNKRYTALTLCFLSRDHARTFLQFFVDLCNLTFIHATAVIRDPKEHAVCRFFQPDPDMSRSEFTFCSMDDAVLKYGLQR